MTYYVTNSTIIHLEATFHGFITSCHNIRRHSEPLDHNNHSPHSTLVYIQNPNPTDFALSHFAESAELLPNVPQSAPDGDPLTPRDKRVHGEGGRAGGALR